MNNYSFNIDNVRYNRISKQAARKAYNAGSPIVICACNLRPGAPWNPEAYISNQDGGENNFDKHVNAYEYYNCANSETGKYAAFYISEK